MSAYGRGEASTGLSLALSFVEGRRASLRAEEQPRMGVGPHGP